MNIELLPVNRWSEIERALKESRSDERLPKPEQSIMLGAFEGDQVIGCIGARRVWNVSPFWVDRQYRGNGTAQQLAEKLITFNTEGLDEMLITTSPHVDRLVHNLGFTPLLGQLWRRQYGE